MFDKADFPSQFQNKRNRKRTGERRTASVSEVQPRITDVIPEPRRVISALPKRATKPEALQQPPPPPQHLSSIRPIRSLPRRGNHASTSPTPSYESTSSLDSIQPSGGFISPLDLLHPPQPVEAAHNPSLYLPVDGGAPLFNFTPPTPLNVAFGNADMGFNIDEILPPWSNDDFTELLNSVLANPTLAGSPVFTSLSVASPESLGSKKSQTPEWTGQELGEDFFAALDGLLGSPGNAIAPESEGSGTPLSLNTTDLTTASNSAEISPVTTIGPYAMIQTPHNLTTDTAETTDVCPLTTSTSTSSSSGNTTPIDALHPFIPPTILNPGTESTYSDSERWTSGVLAFDCGGAEWQGYDEKFVLGGDWDFSGMLEGVEA